MSTRDEHLKPIEAKIVDYAKRRLRVFSGSERLEHSEIGDGNINYVFRIRDPKSGASAIVKYADANSRSSGKALDIDRNRIEAELLRLQGRYAPGLVPEVYDYDREMCCLAMEDLSDYAILRYELIKHKKFPTLADNIAEFIVNTTIPTIDAVAESSDKKRMVGRYINPDLCRITEQLVYTDPYTNRSGRNKVTPSNAEFVKRELYDDEKLRLEAAKLKYRFMNDAQALIHGDLHSGSIFVKGPMVKVFDPEFAYFGPIGYDVGNFIGNLCFAWANACVSIRDAREKEEYIGWLDETIARFVDLFARKFLIAFRQHVTDPMMSTAGYDEWFLSEVLSDSAGVAGLEMNRRTVGVAQVKDLTSLGDTDERTRAERIVILAAKDFILQRRAYSSGRKYCETLHEVAERVPG